MDGFVPIIFILIIVLSLVGLLVSLYIFYKLGKSNVTYKSLLICAVNSILWFIVSCLAFLLKDTGIGNQPLYYCASAFLISAAIFYSVFNKVGVKSTPNKQFNRD